jgi:hypothetical protein
MRKVEDQVKGIISFHYIHDHITQSLLKFVRQLCKSRIPLDTHHASASPEVDPNKSGIYPNEHQEYLREKRRKRSHETIPEAVKKKSLTVGSYL